MRNVCADCFEGAQVADTVRSRAETNIIERPQNDVQGLSRRTLLRPGVADAVRVRFVRVFVVWHPLV